MMPKAYRGATYLPTHPPTDAYIAGMTFPTQKYDFYSFVLNAGLYML